MHGPAGCVQLHPLPVIAVAVKPAGMLSTTVTVPDVGAPPAFDTVIVYVAPVWPGMKLPACVLTIARSGDATRCGVPVEELPW